MSACRAATRSASATCACRLRMLRPWFEFYDGEFGMTDRAHRLH
jgi:hypothetical protein